MASLESLRIPEEKKKYITEKLNPLLEDMVTECLTELPEDPVNFMIAYLRKRNQGDEKYDIIAENEKLKAEAEQMKETIRHTSQIMCQATGKDLEESDDDSEDDDDDDDDFVDELPESFCKPMNQMSKARASVSAEVYGEWNKKKLFSPPVHEKDEEQRERILKVLNNSFLFSALDESDLNIVVNAMEEEKLSAKERPINQGDIGDCLYVVEKGSLDCYKKFNEDEDEKLIKTCESGDVFGELALLYNCRRAASVEAREECVVFRLDRETFNHIVKDSAAKKRERHTQFLKSVPLLAKMEAYELSQLADALKSENIPANSVIMKQGDPGDKFYMLEKGTCRAEKVKKDTSEPVVVMEYEAGNVFGELALLRDEPRAATVIATSDSKVLSLDRRSFRRLLGPLQEILAKTSDKYQ